LGLFKGLEKLKLYGDPHGFMWEREDIKGEIENIDKHESDVWSIVDSDKKENTLTLALARKKDDANGTLRERTVVMWLNANFGYRL